METVIELKPFGEFWQITHNGQIVACALTRSKTIEAAAALLRRKLQDPACLATITLIGLDQAELLAAQSLDPNWKRKGPRIELDLFEQAETYLQTELIPEEETHLLNKYHHCLEEHNFNQALTCLMELGERQDCKNPFWRVLEQLAICVWPTQHMVDRRAKGQRETKITHIQQRAKGRF